MITPYKKIATFEKQKSFLVKDQFLSNRDDYKDLKKNKKSINTTFIVIEMLNHNKLMVVLTFPKSKRGAKAYNLESYKCLCPQKLRQIVLLTSHYRHFNGYLAQQHYPVHGSILPELSVPSKLLFFLQDYSIMND